MEIRPFQFGIATLSALSVFLMVPKLGEIPRSYKGEVPEKISPLIARKILNVHTFTS